MKEDKKRMNEDIQQNAENHFLEEERHNERIGNAVNEPTPVYSTDDSTLQTGEEQSSDKSRNPANNDSIDVSNDDLHNNTDNYRKTAGMAGRKQ